MNERQELTLRTAVGMGIQRVLSVELLLGYKPAKLKAITAAFLVRMTSQSVLALSSSDPMCHWINGYTPSTY